MKWFLSSRELSGLWSRESRRSPKRNRSWTLEGLEGRRLLAQGIQSMIDLPEAGTTNLISGPGGDLWLGVNPSTASAEIEQISLGGSVSPIPVLGNPPTEPFTLTSLANGPDGNVWFTAETGPNRKDQQVVIGHLTPAGVATELPSIPLGAGLDAVSNLMVSGPDGDLWFAYSVVNAKSQSQNFIGQVTPAGAVTLFPVSSLRGKSLPLITSLVAGADGNLWFTQGSGAHIVLGRMTPGGAVTQFPIGKGKLASATVGNGPDGSLIVTGQTLLGRNEVFQVTTAGAMTRYKVPMAIPQSTLSYLGAADGSLWFTDQNAAGEVDLERSTARGAARAYSLPTAVHDGLVFAGSMTAGQDGNLYVLEYALGALDANTTVDRISPSELS